MTAQYELFNGKNLEKIYTSIYFLLIMYGIKNYKHDDKTYQK